MLREKSTLGGNWRFQVWVNGESAGQNEGGFLPFDMSIHELLHFGGENVLVVEADNIGRISEVKGSAWAGVPTKASCAK